MAYELWDTKSGNLIDTFPTEKDALEEIRVTIAELGRESVATYALAKETARDTKLIAKGEELAERALAAIQLADAGPPVATGAPVHA